MSSSAHVLRRRDDRHVGADLGPDPLQVRANRLRRHGRSLPGRRAACPVRRCEKKRSGLQHVQTSRAEHVVDAGRVQRTLGGTPEVELAGRERRRRRTRTRRAPRPRRPPRSSTARSPGRRRPGAARRASRRPTRTIPASRPRQPACRTATAGSPPVRASAIGRQSAVIARIGTAGSSVQRPSPGSPRAPGSARCTSVECTCRLQREPLGIGADRGTEEPAVLVDALDVVAGHPAEVERRVRALADAAFRGSRRRPSRPGGSQRIMRSSRARSQQLLALVALGILDDLVEQRPQRLPELRPFGVAEPDQVAAVDGQVGEPVRLRALLLDEHTKALGPLRRRPPAASSPARSAARCASRSNAMRSPWRARNRRASDVRGLVRDPERMLPHEPDDVLAQLRRIAQPAQHPAGDSGADRSWSPPSRSASGFPRSCSSAASRTSNGAPASAAAWTTAKTCSSSVRCWKPLCCS